MFTNTEQYNLAMDSADNSDTAATTSELWKLQEQFQQHRWQTDQLFTAFGSQLSSLSIQVCDMGASSSGGTVQPLVPLAAPTPFSGEENNFRQFQLQ